MRITDETIAAAEDFMDAIENTDHPYHALAAAFAGAYRQATRGKGRDRHANDLPFDAQRMQTLSDAQNSTKGLAYQVGKKACESCDMDADKAIHELEGALVYAAGMIVWRERHRTPEANSKHPVIDLAGLADIPPIRPAVDKK